MSFVLPISNRRVRPLFLAGLLGVRREQVPQVVLVGAWPVPAGSSNRSLKSSATGEPDGAAGARAAASSAVAQRPRTACPAGTSPGRHRPQQAHPDDLQHDEGHHALVDVECREHLPGHAAQVEQREPKGGVRKLVCRFTPIITPSQTGSTPSLISAGAAIGTTTKMISNVSRKKPRKKITSITASTAVKAPPGSDESAACTRFSPPTAEHEAEDARTEQDDEHHRGDGQRRRMTSRRIARLKLRLAAESSIAPTAPTEADSVGVAMPARMEPSTDRISSSGGANAFRTRPAGRRAGRRSSRARARLRIEDHFARIPAGTGPPAPGPGHGAGKQLPDRNRLRERLPSSSCAC